MARSVIKYPDSLRIKVLEDDIKKGRAQDCYKCPIAIAATRAIEQAIGRKMPRSHYVVVMGNVIDVCRTRKLKNVGYPELSTLKSYSNKSRGNRFIRAFDYEAPLDYEKIAAWIISNPDVKPFIMTVKSISV